MYNKKLSRYIPSIHLKYLYFVKTGLTQFMQNLKQLGLLP